MTKAVYIAFASIILLEVALRISSLFPSDTPFYINDANVGFWVRPHVTLGKNKTNSSGFNDIERQNAKRTINDLRVVVVGDSFVFGALPRKSNFVPVIEDLARNAPVNVEV